MSKTPKSVFELPEGVHIIGKASDPVAVKYFAHYDPKTGDILGFYAQGIHSTFPEPCAEITEAQWREALANPGRRKISTETFKMVECLPAMPSRSECLAFIRRVRDNLLSKCDWTQVADVPMTDEQRTAWRAYRQVLRDFPDTCNPYNPTWPDEPKEV